jgi:hypothetical protein
MAVIGIATQYVSSNGPSVVPTRLTLINQSELQTVATHLNSRQVSLSTQRFRRLHGTCNVSNHGMTFQIKTNPSM